MGSNEAHGAEGVNSICALLGEGWKCQGTESSDGFFLELVKVNSTSLSKHCPTFLLDEEHKLGFAGRGIFYAAGLVFCFLGLALITGVYMKALDSIVKQTRRAVREDPITGGNLFHEERVWNPAVADITLLALGTCIPQVSLAIIDTLQHLDNMSQTSLGTGTLLGSAAFNLFPILSVCVIAPRDFQLKSIRDVGVYVVELLWSFWAYAWLYIILQVWTPGVVTISEAALTILQFPLLVLHAFIQEKQWKYFSIPWRVSETTSHVHVSEELSVVSEGGTKLGTRSGSALETSLEGLDKLYAQRADVFEDVDPSAAGDETFDGFLRRQESVKSCHSWKETATLWKQQFFDAMTVPGVDDGTGRKVAPSIGKLIQHHFLSHWKITFAFIPPVELFHGWPAFLCTIMIITFISYMVVELSNLFDCVTGLDPYILAMTILATGTSFPNLVASKIAAQDYETADSAIANINASNCINVFIGFGIPWFISAIYHSHETFRLPSSDGLSIVLAGYFIGAVLGFVMLSARRRFVGGELGGPRKWAWFSAAYYMLLWFAFLLLACFANI